MYGTFMARSKFMVDAEKVMEGIHLANGLVKDIATYRAMFTNPAHPILVHLKEPLKEMEDKLEDYLISASRIVGE